MRKLTTMCARALIGVLALSLGGNHVAAQIQNGSFETGDFTGWAATDLTTPLQALQVAPQGTIGAFFVLSVPTDGEFGVVTGFAGDGPGVITLAQDVTIPKATSVLLLDYLVQWDLITGGQPATLDRTFRVLVQPAGGGADLAAYELERAVADTTNFGTTRVTSSVNLKEFADQTVQLVLAWDVPEDDTGAAFMDLDNLRLVGKKLPALQAASLKLGLNFAKPDSDSAKLDIVVPVSQGFLPEGQQITVTIGDIGRVFVLDEKGTANLGSDKLKLSAVSGQPEHRRLVLSYAKGDFDEDVSAYGLTNFDTGKAGMTFNLPVTVLLDGLSTERSFPVLYKATIGKSGTASAKVTPELWAAKLSVKLNLAQPDSDSLSLTTTALTGVGYTNFNEVLEVEIGGVTKVFTLDADGKAVVGTDSVSLKRDAQNPLRHKLTLKCSAGNFQDVSEEFVTTDTPPGGVQVLVPVTVTLDGRAAKIIVPVSYKAKAGKSGSAKG